MAVTVRMLRKGGTQVERTINSKEHILLEYKAKEEKSNVQGGIGNK